MVHVRKYLQRTRDWVSFFYACIYFRVRSHFSNSLVIYIEYGGLGDHLFYSHIPKLVKERGLFKKVYISYKNQYRSAEIKELVWDKNPHVDGFLDEKSFSCKWNLRFRNKKLLDLIAYMYGVDVDGSEPEIYYTPTPILDLQKAVLYDPNYLSNTGNIISLDISEYFKAQEITVDYKMALRGRYLDIPGPRELVARNIYEFIDILYSVNKLYCLTTGTATLAAAIGKQANVLYGEGVVLAHHHSPRNNYIRIK